MTRTEFELEIMRMLNQGVGGAALLDHDQSQREEITRLNKCFEFLEGGIVEREEEIARLREALEGVMTGGNHLALQITNSFGEHPPVEASCEEAMKFYGVGVQGWDGQAWKFDVWVCWKKIMQAQAALAKEATRDKV